MYLLNVYYIDPEFDYTYLLNDFDDRLSIFMVYNIFLIHF